MEADFFESKHNLENNFLDNAGGANTLLGFTNADSNSCSSDSGNSTDGNREETECMIVDEIVNINDKVKITDEYTKIADFLPNWMNIFAWLRWSNNENSLICSFCYQLSCKNFPNDPKRGIIKSNQLSNMAFVLRKHQESVAHCCCIYIAKFDVLKNLLALISRSSKELKDSAELEEMLKWMFSWSKLEFKSFEIAMKNISSFIESKLIDFIKTSKYFSVVADQCRGIIIVRFFTVNGKWEEHVLWSYINEWNVGPSAYLKKFGVDYSKCVIYIANTLCRQCKRCQGSALQQAFLSPRPPSLESFLDILWEMDFLKPLAHLARTVLKISNGYPHKFSSSYTLQHVNALAKYRSEPTQLKTLLENMDTIKKIGLEIYESRAFVEALGLSLIDIETEEKHFKVLEVLQELIVLLKEISESTQNRPTTEQIVKLTQTFNSLKLWSSGVTYISKQQQQQNQQAETIRDRKDEFLQFVEKFIEENQKTVYYNGRDRGHYFRTLCSTNNLLSSDSSTLNEETLRNSFSYVYNLLMKSDGMKPYVDSKGKMFISVKAYYDHVLEKEINIRNCVDISRSFRENPDFITTYSLAYEIFQFCSAMPFMECDLQASLFVAFINEQKIRKSSWCNNNELMQSVLYLICEMRRIPHSVLINWWKQLDE